MFDDDPDAYHEEFLYAVEVARALHDPADDWEAFRDVLWANLTRVFGIEDSAAVSDGGGDAVAAADPPQAGNDVNQRSAARPRV